ncbi:MAG: ATP-dependent sacrificial sulfur transferase LarE [Chloroflexota bacterium]
MPNVQDHAYKTQNLKNILTNLGSVVIAYSGGVDSTFLAREALEALGDKALAVTAVSPSLAASELDEAKELAVQMGVRHVLIDSDEVSDPRYLANGADRCYFCKNEVYSLLVSYAHEQGYAAVIDGTNVDDLRDPRPGRKAAREQGVLSPLVDAGFTKAEIRDASRVLGLPTADKPSMACLSSRIPFGTPISIASLKQVEDAESLLRGLGLGQSRVRHHRDTARIEVEPDDFITVIERRDEIVAGLKSLGYVFVSLDLEGYRTGSMNSALKGEKVRSGR